MYARRLGTTIQHVIPEDVVPVDMRWSARAVCGFYMVNNGILRDKLASEPVPGMEICKRCVPPVPAP